TALLLGAVSAFAQQATITGTVTDTSGGVLPGVTITIIHEETGNTFEAVSDAQGQFRIPVRVGAHRLTASLSGFQTITRTGLQLLLNQTLAVTLQLAPAPQTREPLRLSDHYAHGTTAVVEPDAGSHPAAWASHAHRDGHRHRRSAA